MPNFSATAAADPQRSMTSAVRMIRESSIFAAKGQECLRRKRVKFPFMDLRLYRLAEAVPDSQVETAARLLAALT